MGKKDKSQLDGEGVDDGVLVGVVTEGAVGLVGRSGWSVGLAGREVGCATGVMDVVVPAIVVVEMMSVWLSSSYSVGMGRSTALEASIDSPQSLRCQSTKVPVFSFTTLSLTRTVQVPIPDSPLENVSILQKMDIAMLTSEQPT